MDNKKQREMFLRKQAKEEYKWQEEYQELLRELSDDEYCLQKRLAKKSLRREDMEEELAECRKKLADIVTKYQLRLGNLALFVKDVWKCMGQMEAEELLFCFTVIACDANKEYGLMGMHRDCNQTDAIDFYLTFRKRSRKLQKNIRKLKEMEQEYQEIVHSKLVETAEDVQEKVVEELSRIVAFYYPDRNLKAEILRDNLSYTVGMVEANPLIKKAAAVFFFRVILMHHQRLEKQENFHFAYKKLWNYQRYNIEWDNGKNYKEYRKNVEMFCRILNLCKKYYGRDIYGRLNKYIFTNISNLSLWILEDEEIQKKPLVETIPIYLHRRSISIFQTNPMQCDPCFIFRVQEKEQRKWAMEEENVAWLEKSFSEWMNDCIGKDGSREEFLEEFERAYAVNGKKVKTILLEAFQGISQRQHSKKEQSRFQNPEEKKFILVSIFYEYTCHVDNLIEERLCCIGEKIMEAAEND